MKFKVGDIVKIVSPDYANPIYYKKVLNRIGIIVSADDRLSYPYNLRFIDNLGNLGVANIFCDKELIKLTKEEAAIELL